MGFFATEAFVADLFAIWASLVSFGELSNSHRRDISKFTL
jgi:hypothetical protein